MQEWIATAKKIIRDEYDCTYRFWDEVVETDVPEQINNPSTGKNMFDDLPAYRTMSTGTLDKLTCYLCSPPEDVANKDLLIWWNDHKCEYPCMARMALDYHTIPSKLLSYLILL